MQQIILILHVLVAVSLIALVLLQHGKGADIGASFGSGASQTVFGSQGSGSFLLKLTGALGILFFITSILLSFIASKQVNQDQFVLPSAVKTAQPTSQQNPATSTGSVPASLLPQNSGTSSVAGQGQ